MCNLILAFIAMFIFSACGSSDRDATGGEGSIAFSVDWQNDSNEQRATSNEVIPPLAKGDSGGFSDNAVSRASSLDCSSSGVSSVSATVYSSSGSTLATGGPWSCSAHSGSITGVSAGTNRKVVFLGKDSNGYVKYKGEQTGITVTDGQTSNAGTITAALFVPTPSLPSDTSTVTNGSFSLSWPSSSSASSYQIQISTDSSFTGTTEDTTATETSYTPSTLSVGTYYWRIRASDSYGNTSQWSEVWSFTVLPGSSDATAPTNTTATNFINSGDSSTSSTEVTLALSSTDNVGVTGYYASETSTMPSGTASGWTDITSTTSYSATVAFTISSGNGTKTVYVWFKDVAGNVSGSMSDTITLSTTDATAPSNTTVSNFINSGGSSTTSTAVTLSISATDTVGVTAYYASESATTPGTTGWTAVTSTTSYSANVSFTLSSGSVGDNTKTVYVWFKDAAGNVSTAASDSITLTVSDSTAPTSQSVSINSGGASTTSTSVTLALSTTDNVGVTAYYASETSTMPSATASGWTAVTSTTSYSASVSFTLSSGSVGNNTKTVYIWFKDSAGNVSAAASDSITLIVSDSTAPTSPSVSINSGGASTTSTSVTLALSATDNVGVTAYYASETSTTPSATASGWTAVTSTTSYSASVSFTLSSGSVGDNTKTVYVWFKDAAGNVSAAASDSITLTVSDSTAPTSPSVSINSGAASTTSTAVTLALSATDGVGVTAYYASETSTTPSGTASGWTAVTSATSYSASVSFILSSVDGTKTVYVWFKDVAGNVSASASDSITLSTGGSLDTTFGTGGKVTTAIGSSSDGANALGIQSDGKIVAAGYSNNGSNYDFALVRYNTDGTLDATFGTGGKVTTAIGSSNDVANALGIQPDGKIVVTGYSNNGSNNEFAVVRYNTDGTLDTTFGTGGMVTTTIGSYDNFAYALGIQSGGKIVVVGSSSNYWSTSDFTLVRYNTDGTLDTTFGTGGMVTTTFGSHDSVKAVAIQSDGKIVAAGYSYGYLVTLGYDFALIRYNTDGTLDTTFGTSGMVTTDIIDDDIADAVVIQSDGKIIAAGGSSNSYNDFTLVRYNTDGTLDATFGTSGIVTTDTGGNVDNADSLVIQSDGKIVAVGRSNNGSNDEFAIARYNTDGTLDTTFGTGGKVTTAIGSSSDGANALGIQSDGKIVAAGYSYNGSNSDFAVVRYLP